MRLCELREIRCLVCSTLHQMFIADPKLAKLVHFQVSDRVFSMNKYLYGYSKTS